MSRAVETWRASCSPCGLTKWLAVMPSRAAVSFMILAKPGTEPPTASASTTAMSLAE